MTRQYLTQHLTDNGCYTEPADSMADGEMWHNCINGQFCFVPFVEDDYYANTTYCHIFYELQVPPPLDNGYESDYYVYVGWREHQLKADLAKIPEQNK